MSIQTSSNDVVVWAVQLEEKKFAWIKGSELAVAGWLPKIDLFKLR
jgi:hypothetical protein